MPFQTFLGGILPSNFSSWLKSNFSGTDFGTETACSKDTLRDGGRLNPPIICAAVSASVGEAGVLLAISSNQKYCYNLQKNMRPMKN